MQGGVFGAVATADAFIAVITHSAKPSVNGTTAAPNGAAAANGAGMDKVVTVKAAPYDYSLPVAHTALVMIDFQKDFMAEGVGFGAALGNDVTLLRVSVCHMSCSRSKGGKITQCLLHTLAGDMLPSHIVLPLVSNLSSSWFCCYTICW